MANASISNPKQIKECSVSGCHDATYGRGFCQLHYRRWYKTGSVELSRFVCTVVDTSGIERQVSHDLTGQQFQSLLVLSLSEQKYPRPLWNCLCLNCGNTTAVTARQLLVDKQQGCGCFSITHGRTRTPEYQAFLRAKKRCSYTKSRDYPRYGGRGIEFRFTSFEEFLDYVGERPSDKHSLDRIDVNGHYEKGNVRWATWSEQARNKRQTVYLTYQGVVKPSVDWAEQFEIQPRTLTCRILAGWCVECALTLPVNRGSSTSIRCPHKDALALIEKDGE